jgi:hypothetical protein
MRFQEPGRAPLDQLALVRGKCAVQGKQEFDETLGQVTS